MLKIWLFITIILSLFILCEPSSQFVDLDYVRSPFGANLMVDNEDVQNAKGQQRTSEIVENEYIVQFNNYLSHGEQRNIITNLLQESSAELQWELKERNNPAWLLPSDFSLIKLTGESSKNRSLVAEALKALERSTRIRYVVPQRRFIGVLSSHERDQSTENYSSQHCSLLSLDTMNQTGRMSSKFPKDENEPYVGRKLHATMQITELLNAHLLWEKGYTGAGVKVAVFDTGIRENHPHFRNIKKITNWTDEKKTEDGLGHGTFVAGVISSQSDCLGFAPDAEMYIFRVFTDNRVSYTSWFLDAFNYAIYSGVDVLNLSIGGPDFMDKPFVEKVWELSANNIIVVSAIGNDGTLYGTLNNPADQLDVIGVGGIDFGDKLASFSSRGMTTWELPGGYGRVKPDVVAYGQNVQGSRIYGGCRALSGTSVASPVVAGAVALLVSTARKDIVNPASLKQVLLASAERLPDANIFEQGAGKLNLMGAYEELSTYVPHASAFPSALDMTTCPYMWPYCSQPLYFGGMPTMVNITVLNGMGVSGEFDGSPIWKPGKNGNLLEVSFTYGDLWPWSGYLAVHLRVHSDAAKWTGTAEGLIVFNVVSPAMGEIRHSTVEVPLKVNIVPTPPRNKRILWDQYHNLRYPSGYFPRDALDLKEEPFDWNGDHIHTNFKELYSYLRDEGYFVEVLGAPFTCFDASQYGTLLLVDPEEEYFPVELKKLARDIEVEGLSLVVIADWYNEDVINKIKFFDENTKRWWTPATGGSNIPALNDLLGQYDIAFGDQIYHGTIESKKHSALLASGTSIVKFPAHGQLGYFAVNDQTKEVLGGTAEKVTVPLVGLYSTVHHENKLKDVLSYETERRGEGAPIERGRIAVFGDSSCLDDANKKRPACFWLLSSLLRYSMDNIVDTLDYSPLETTFQQGAVPKRMDGNDFHKYSKVVAQSASCKRTEFKRYNATEVLEIVWEEPKVVSHANNGNFREKSFTRTVSRGYGNTLFPFVLGFVAAIALMALVLIMRRDAAFPKKPQV